MLPGSAMLPEHYRYTDRVDIQVRFNHEECGDTRSRLYIKNTGKGLLYHCHNCSFSGYQPHGTLSPQQTLSLLKQEVPNEKINKPYLDYPSDFTSEIPELGLIWLYKYGLTDEEIKHHGFGGYSNMSRLFIPIFNISKKLIYYQGRYLGLDKPKIKYLNVRSNVKLIYKEVLNATSNDIVLVEDVVSAIKVGRVATSWALLGSYIPLELILRLMDTDGQVYVWLDPDKAKEAVRYSKQIRSITGKVCKPIFTEKDPKDYTTDEIVEILK